MKKSLLAVVAALAMAGCSQNDLVDEIDNGGQINKKAEIGVNTFVGKGSRAAEANTTTLEGNGFQLYCYNTGTTTISAETTPTLGTAFFTAEATHSADGWSFGSYYWPLTDNLQFFGYSPISNNITGYTATGKYPTFNYKVPAVDLQEDLLTASTLNQTKNANATAGVQLVFKHILTQINFKFQGKEDGFKYTVTKVELTGIESNGTYTYNDSGKGNWENAAESTTASYEYPFNGDITGKTLSTVTAGSSLMLLPQTLGANAKIEVTYSTTDEKGATYFNGSKSISLTGTWGTGQKILYTITLPTGAEAITVVPTVESSWGNEDTINKEAQ